MRGVSIVRLLTSSAVALLLAGAAGVLAQTAETQPDKTPAVSEKAAVATDPAQGRTNPVEPAGTAESPPAEGTATAAPSNPQDSTAPSAAETVAEPATITPAPMPPAAEQSAGEPQSPAAAAATPAPEAKPDEATPPPAAPSTADVPPTELKPTISTGEDTVPTTSAVAPAPAPTNEPTTPGAAAPGEPVPTAVADANTPVTEQLRGLADGKFDRIIGGKKDRAAIEAFYSARNFAPLWITDGKVNERAKAAVAYLGHVDADGLDPADYPVPNFASITEPAALAAAEIRLGTSLITYAHHAQLGRVHWSRVSADISYDRKAPEPAEVLGKMAEANDAKDVSEALDSYEPHARPYLVLKAKLAELRAGKGDTGGPRIADGPVLKVGMEDSRVPQLRARLGMAEGTGTTYDKALADAVTKFQKERELKATGTLTSATVEALNGRKPDRPTDVIIANMERWRWVTRDLGKTYVMVNLAEFALRVFHDGQQVWVTRVVDGKPTMPTPIMSADMKYITVNPTWNVPPSIVNKEYLPALARDPSVLARAGLKMGRNSDGSVHIYQPPGERNALGRVRFNFPNKFLVYQHDTPDKHLFALDRRAFSHGCMRVQDPAKYAEVLLSFARPGEGYTEERIRKMFGTGETDIQFPAPIPVHLTYQTAFVDNKGKLEFLEDVYGRDKALLEIMKGEERRVADTAIEHRPNPIRRQVLALPDQQSLWGDRWGDRPGERWGRSAQNGSYDGGQGFFSRLFGGSFVGAPPAPAPRSRAAARRTEIR
jgi:L,D-transpeptidase YcbB